MVVGYLICKFLHVIQLQSPRLWNARVDISHVNNIELYGIGVIDWILDKKSLVKNKFNFSKLIYLDISVFCKSHTSRTSKDRWGAYLYLWKPSDFKAQEEKWVSCAYHNFMQTWATEKLAKITNICRVILKEWWLSNKNPVDKYWKEIKKISHDILTQSLDCRLPKQKHVFNNVAVLKGIQVPLTFHSDGTFIECFYKQH